MRSLAGVLAVVLAVPTLLITPPGPRPAAAAPACAAVAPTQRAAMQLAAACARPVVVESSRTELSQVTAQPDGRLTFESAVEPQRVRTGSTWADIDLTLHSTADGRWRPAASVADVSLSGGGAAPFAAVTRDGHTMTLSWPDAVLPAPTVSGSKATYAEVRPGVDLVVQATRTGFTHTLVVKNATAAADPAVRDLRMAVGGDVVLHAGIDGTLRAAAAGRAIAEAAPALMWDSRAGSGGVPRSTPAAPGDEDRLAVSRALCEYRDGKPAWRKRFTWRPVQC